LESGKADLRRSIVQARVVIMEMLPIDVKEAVRAYRERVVPAGREQEGFRGAWMLTDPETGEGMSISLWESAEDMRSSEESDFHRRELGELEAFFVSAPVRKHYEVSVEE
jgi:heme-degrading monooxygenase HmoA